VTTKQAPPRAVFIAIAVAAFVLSACAETAATPSAAADEPIATAAAAASASATADASAEPASAEVRIEGSQFVPAELTIAAGTEVTFVNTDTFAHTATEGTGGQAADDPVADEMLDAGASGTVTFDEPGTFEITCRFHPTMQMTIVVEG
jgi:plastocyanin